MASYTEKEKAFRAKYAEEVAKVSRANNVDVGIASLMILNNAQFLSEAMKQQGYKPGLSIDALVKDALEVEAAKIKTAPAKK
jgi:hypothetical protein